MATEEFGLNWRGKREALKSLDVPCDTQLNLVLEESLNGEKSKNLIVEGDNLDFLKLAQKSCWAKVKMIYIDPPYNTGQEFIYKDKFRYHSDWLNMMYPRLVLARKLLRQDGVIFISIDDHELANLRLLMDEIFGEENFLVNLVWQNKEGGGGSDSKAFKRKHEYILVYARDAESAKIRGVPIANEKSYHLTDEYVEQRGPYKLQALAQASIQYSPSLDYGIEAPDGTLIYPSYRNKRACYRWSKEKVKWGLAHGFIVIKKDTQGRWKVWSKQYLNVDNEGRPIIRTSRPGGVIEKYSTTLASKQLEDLFGTKVFDYAKPYELITYLINLVVDPHEEGVILDFFAGSGTTGHAVLALNHLDGGSRRFILVQRPEPISNPHYPTIAEITKERIRRVIRRLEEDVQTRDSGNPMVNRDERLGFKFYRMVKK